MNTRQETLATRWDSLVDPATKRGLGSFEVRQLAKQAGTQWYVSRGDEKLEDFLEKNGKSLLYRIPGFGRGKLEKLCEILEWLIEHDTDFIEEIAPIISAQQRLAEWGCPIDFPCRLAALPIRIHNYCERKGIITIGALVVEWEKIGYSGLISVRNLGKKSVLALENLITNITTENREAVALVLPLKPEEPGIDFAVSLAHVISEQSTAELELLQLRLVELMTLEESAEVRGFTRERVRQIEAKFLAGIEERLGYFEWVKSILLSAWMAREDWFTLVGWHGSEEGAILAKASLESIFRGSAHGVARDLARYARMEALELEVETDPDLWFGGVPLDRLLAKLPDEQERQSFCERLMGSRHFRLDQSTGKIQPKRTDLRRSVEAMLAGEDHPLPLSWVIELLKRSGHHPRVARPDILRKRSEWRRRGNFPDGMIRWDE